MKPDRFEIPGSLFVERSLRKDGPSPVYVAWMPNTSRMFYDKESVLRFCKWPASTPSGVALREWLGAFDDVAIPEQQPNEGKIQADNWGPEGHAEEPQENRSNQSNLFLRHTRLSDHERSSVQSLTTGAKSDVP